MVICTDCALAVVERTNRVEPAAAQYSALAEQVFRCGVLGQVGRVIAGRAGVQAAALQVETCIHGAGLVHRFPTTTVCAGSQHVVFAGLEAGGLIEVDGVVGCTHDRPPCLLSRLFWKYSIKKKAMSNGNVNTKKSQAPTLPEATSNTMR